MKDEIISFCSQDSSHRLILLHGWGADAQDLIPLGKELLKRIDLKFDLVSLKAPQAHPEGFGRQWYGLFPPDWSAIPEAIRNLENRLKKTITSKIPFEKTFLLGFSQGGAMALHGGLGLPFAGLICCSGYPHPGWEPKPSFSSPVLLTHGKLDDVVPISAIGNIANLLERNQLNFETTIFNGGHEISPEAINKISLFIQQYV